MAFNTSNLIETPAEEAERLQASRPRLAALPVNITVPDLTGLLIDLAEPMLREGGNSGEETKHLVVTLQPRAGEPEPARRLEDGRYMRNDHHYRGVIVHSDYPSYPIGGYDITVDEAMARRGRRVGVHL